MVGTMPLLTVLMLMALPFLEVWLMIVIGSQVGALWTVAALVSLMALGMSVLRHGGRAFRGVLKEAEEAMRIGEHPRKGVFDPLMLMAGGVMLVVPGFITAALGLLLITPFTRPLLRWAFTGWVERRMQKMRDRMEEELLDQGLRVPPQSTQDGTAGPGGPGSGSGPAGTSSPNRGRVIQGRFEPEDEPGNQDHRRP